MDMVLRDGNIHTRWQAIPGVGYSCAGYPKYILYIRELIVWDEFLCYVPSVTTV